MNRVYNHDSAGDKVHGSGWSHNDNSIKFCLSFLMRKTHYTCSPEPLKLQTSLLLF